MSSPLTPQPADAASQKSPSAASNQPAGKLTRLEKLKQKRKQIAEQIRGLESKESKKQQKLETRRKILVGAAVLNQVKQGKLEQSWLDGILNIELTRDCDRQVFDLPKQKPSNNGAG